MESKDLNEIWSVLKSNFNKLTFVEETHTYYVDGKILPSVSTLIKDFYKEFDTEGESIRYAEKKGFEIEDVLGAWRGENIESTTKGTKVHLFGEDYVKWKYFEIGEKPTAFCKQSLAIIQFWNDLPKYLVPVALELQMYNEELGYCGTADILLYNTLEDTFVIADYKTNKELFGNAKYPQKLLLHLSDRLDLKQDNFGK